VLYFLTGTKADAARIAAFYRRHGVEIPANLNEEYVHLMGRGNRLHLSPGSTHQVTAGHIRPEFPIESGPSAHDAMSYSCAGTASVAMYVNDPVRVKVTTTLVSAAWVRTIDGGDTTIVTVDSAPYCNAKTADGYVWPFDTTWYVDRCDLAEQGGSNYFDRETVSEFHNDDFGQNSSSTTVFATTAANVGQGGPDAAFTYSTFMLAQGESHSLLSGFASEDHTESCDNPQQECESTPGANWNPDTQTCELTGENGSPIIIGVQNSQYRLTSAQGGVDFDIDGDGITERIAWTPKNSDLVFLALDRNNDGRINDGTELFGDYTVPGAMNGFEALRRLAAEVSVLSDTSLASDHPLFAHLLLWNDKNHNGISEASELVAANQFLTSIGLEYQAVGRRDIFGNLFRYAGWVRGRSNSAGTSSKNDGGTHRIYDVFLVIAR
jgi:hypothetical protein